MSNLYERLKELCIEKGITGASLCDEIGYKSHSLLTELKSGRKKTITADVASDIANYFDVSVDYILGKTEERKPALDLNNDNLKFALWQSDASEADDEMIADVKEYAKMRMKLKKQKKSDDNGK